MGRIFVNYRRDDTKADARQVVRHLQTHFGKSHVFFDVKSLAKGERFDLAIDGAVSQCDAMVIIIGEKWLSLTKPDGTQRLFAEDDFVRYEIERGLHHNKPILPVLIDRTPMPGPDDLPPSIRELSLWNSARVEHETFDRDCVAIAKQLETMTRTSGIKPWWLGAAAAGALIIGLGGGWGLNQVLVGEDLKDQLVATSTALGTVKDDLQERSGDLAKAERTVVDMRSAMMDMEQQNKDLRDQVTAGSKLQTDLTSVRAQLEVKTSELAAKDRDIQSKSEIIGHKQARIGQLDDQIAKLTADLQAEQDREKKTAASVIKRHRSLKDEIATLKKEVEAQSSLVQTRTSEIERLKGQTEAQSGEVAALDARIDILEAEKRTLGAEIETLTKAQAKAADEATALRDAAAVDELKIKTLTEEKKALEAEVEAKTKEADTIQRQLEASKEEAKSITEQVQAACRKVSWFSTDVEICDEI